MTGKLGGGDYSNELGDVDMFGKNVFATNVVLECVLPAVHVATQSALKLDLQQVICWTSRRSGKCEMWQKICDVMSRVLLVSFPCHSCGSRQGSLKQKTKRKQKRGQAVEANKAGNMRLLRVSTRCNNNHWSVVGEGGLTWCWPHTNRSKKLQTNSAHNMPWLTWLWTNLWFVLLETCFWQMSQKPALVVGRPPLAQSTIREYVAQVKI